MKRARVDVTTAADQGTLGALDPEQLATAGRLSRVIYTSNMADFARLHAAAMREGRHHAGIIAVVPQSMPIGEQLRCLLNLTTALSAEEMVDRFEYLAGWG